ncbi:hypothetical protein D3Z53_02300 [Lachnospiraceae bacterium]|jgi:hypothetical protein|nr:hypothetical protein [Lachnospiraceae bacterium]
MLLYWPDAVQQGARRRVNSNARILLCYKYIVEIKIYESNQTAKKATALKNIHLVVPFLQDSRPLLFV